VKKIILQIEVGEGMMNTPLHNINSSFILFCNYCAFVMEG